MTDRSLEEIMLQEARDERRSPHVIVLLLHRGEALRVVTWTEEYGDGEGEAYVADLAERLGSLLARGERLSTRHVTLDLDGEGRFLLREGVEHG